MCSNTPLSTAGGALAAGGWEDCMVRVTGSPRGRLIRSERRLVAAGGRLGGVAAPARPAAPRPRRGRRPGGGVAQRACRARRPPPPPPAPGPPPPPPRPPRPPGGLPGAALEPAHDH